MNEEMELQNALAALEGADLDARVAAVQRLGELRHAAAVPQLVEILVTADPGTRFIVVKALGLISHEFSLPALLIEMRGADPWVRVVAVGALIQLGSIAIPGLIDAMDHEEKAVRRAAAKALGKIGERDHRAVRALSAALLDIDSGVRRFAAEALGRLGDTTVVPHLAEVLGDGDADTRIAAFKALASFGTPEAQDVVSRWVEQ